MYESKVHLRCILVLAFATLITILQHKKTVYCKHFSFQATKPYWNASRVDFSRVNWVRSWDQVERGRAHSWILLLVTGACVQTLFSYCLLYKSWELLIAMFFCQSERSRWQGRSWWTERSAIDESSARCRATSCRMTTCCRTWVSRKPWCVRRTSNSPRRLERRRKRQWYDGNNTFLLPLMIESWFLLWRH